MKTKSKIVLEFEDGKIKLSSSKESIGTALYNLDMTLATVIVTLLKAFKEKQKGIPSKVFLENKLDSNNPKHELKAKEIWNSYLNEMIWAFNTSLEEESFTEFEICFTKFKSEREKEILKGRMLFAKYFDSLWL